jgi:hypothetical protein
MRRFVSFICLPIGGAMLTGLVIQFLSIKECYAYIPGFLLGFISALISMPWRAR